MQVHPRLKLVLILGLLSGCQTLPASVPRAGRASAKTTTATCIDYQPCRVRGTLRVVGRAGEHTEATITQSDQRCVPLLLSRRQVGKLGWSSGKVVTFEGLALVRIEDPGDITLAIGYLDRWMPTDVCLENKTVIYVERYFDIGSN